MGAVAQAGDHIPMATTAIGRAGIAERLKPGCGSTSPVVQSGVGGKRRTLSRPRLRPALASTVRIAAHRSARGTHTDG